MSIGLLSRFYHSPAWKRTRAAYIARRVSIDGGLCEECHDQLGDTVHHRIWLTEDNVGDPRISLDPKNLKLVCRDCHAKEKDPMKRCTKRGRRYQFDLEGNVIAPGTPRGAPRLTPRGTVGGPLK